MRNWRTVKCVALAVVCSLGLLALGWTPAQGKSKPNVVRIGVVDSLFRNVPPQLMKVLMGPLKSLMKRQTGMTGEVVPGGDPVALGKKLQEGKVGLGVFHGVEFAWAQKAIPKLKPLIICVNRYPVRHVYLIVRKGSKVSRIEDLRRKTVGLPEMTKEDCRLFLHRKCVPADAKAETFFGEITVPFDGEEALDNIVDAYDDATVVTQVDLENYRKVKPGCARQLKILKVSEAFPCGVVAYHPGTLSQEKLSRFRTGMLKAKCSRKGRHLLQMSRLTSFEPVPANFDRQLTEILKAYPAAK